MQPFPTLPVPEWQHGQPVSMDSLQKAVDAYIKALEPKRKLQLAAVPAQVRSGRSVGARSDHILGACSFV